MSDTCWWLAQRIAALLPGAECEAVLGDLEERGESGLRRLADVLGWVLRRQWEPWGDWRSWVWGAALPFGGSLLLMGLSVSLAQSGREVPEGTPLALARVIGETLWLLGSGWSCGFVIASQRTRRVSALLACLPCCFCFSRFGIEWLSPLCLLLFLGPVLWGAARGAQRRGLDFKVAVLVGVCATAGTFLSWGSGAGRWLPPGWLIQATLLVPAWYLLAYVGAAQRRRDGLQVRGDDL